MQQNLIIIGKCGRPYGVKGWFHIQSFTADPNNILNYRNWTLLTPQGKQKPVELEGIRAHGNHFVAKIQGIDSPEDAKSIGLFQIAMPQDELPELGENEYYWADLVGLKAILPSGVTLGTVSELFETGANDVIVVKTEQNKELLVPYTDEVVLDVDLDAGTLTVDWDPAERLPHD
jgi:16S rRNA processing protein RimM